MRNWSVAGSIGRHLPRSGRLIQPVYRREFLPEFQRRVSGQDTQATPGRYPARSAAHRRLSPQDKIKPGVAIHDRIT
jgi:hypothetical protein